MELTEEEDFKQWWQEYPEELYKNIFIPYITMMVLQNHDGVWLT